MTFITLHYNFLNEWFNAMSLVCIQVWACPGFWINEECDAWSEVEMDDKVALFRLVKSTELLLYHGL